MTLSESFVAEDSGDGDALYDDGDLPRSRLRAGLARTFCKYLNNSNDFVFATTAAPRGAGARAAPSEESHMNFHPRPVNNRFISMITDLA